MDALIRRIARGALPLALAAVPTAALADPAIWKVSDKDSAIWLFGSVHILDAQRPWRTPTFDAVLAGAEQVYFELVLDEAGMAALGRLAIERGLLPPGQSLWDLLTPEQNEALDEALRSLGIERALVERMQPWMAGLTISSAALVDSGVAGNATFAGGIESTLQAELPDERERGLETPEEQITFLAMGTLEEQSAALIAMLDELEAGNAAFSALIDAWLAGDIATIHDEVVASVGSVDSEVYRTVISDRNVRWAATASELLADDVPALVVVGAAHLAGPYGLPALLAKRGFEVERIDGAELE